MTPNELIDLARRKNEAYVKLMLRRHQVYTPSTLSKSTADDRKIALEYGAREEQRAYDDLCDEYDIRMEEYRKHLLIV